MSTSARTYVTKKAVRAFVYQIIDFIRQPTSAIYLKRLSEYRFKREKAQPRGYYYIYKNKIEIDFRYEILPTLIHECLHHFHPKWSEDRVYAEEAKIVKLLSKKSAILLFKELAQVIR